MYTQGNFPFWNLCTNAVLEINNDFQPMIKEK